MSYAMRYRMVIRTVTTPGIPDPNDPILAAVGDTLTDTVNPTGGAGTTGSPYTYATPTGPVLVSLGGAASAVIGITKTLQSKLHFNVRAEVWGNPVGHAEPGNPDLTAAQKLELCYVQADTPSAALVLAILAANRKSNRHVGKATYTIVDAGPEVGVTETPIAAEGV